MGDDVRVFVGQTVLLPRTSAPLGFAPCDGRTLSKEEHPVLFARIGGRFGERGERFALPDYRPVAPSGANYFIALQGTDPPRGGSVDDPIATNDPWFVGQILLLPLDSAPTGFVPCDGRSLSLDRYILLYSVLGSRFGGDDKASFKLPDYRSIAPAGSSYYIAVSGMVPSRGPDHPVAWAVIPDADAFVSQITLVSFPYAPRGFALCDGAPLGVNDYPALWVLLGPHQDTDMTCPLPDYTASVPALSTYVIACVGALPPDDPSKDAAVMPRDNQNPLNRPG